MFGSIHIRFWYCDFDIQFDILVKGWQQVGDVTQLWFLFNITHISFRLALHSQFVFIAFFYYHLILVFIS